MAREKVVVDGVVSLLGELSGIKVHEQVHVDKWDSYAFDYAGILATQDERFTEALEDASAVSNLGRIDIYIMYGSQVKKSATQGKAVLRNALQDIAEKIEYKLANKVIEGYQSDYESCDFSPIHFVSNEPMTYLDDETKGCGLVVFRIFYTKYN